MQTGKQASEFLIYNDIIIEEQLETKIDPKNDPLSFPDITEYVQIIEGDERPGRNYKSTKLGKAILNSGLLPEEGLIIYLDLMKAQKSLVLQNELHLLYLLTPVSMPEIRVDWELFFRLFQLLSPIEQQIGNKIEIDINHLQRGIQHSIQNTGIMDFKQSHKRDVGEVENNYEFIEVNKTLIKDLKHVRFYLTLILKDLIRANDIEKVSEMYGVSKGALQSLKKKATFFPNVVCNIGKQLEWFSIFHILSQFQDRVNFEIQEDLEEVMHIKNIEVSEARAIYEAGFTEMKTIAKAKPIHIYKALQSAFVPEKQYSTNIDDYLFKPTNEISCASVSKAEQIINNAKAIMKQRRKQLTLKEQKERMEWIKGLKSKNNFQNEKS